MLVKRKRSWLEASLNIELNYRYFSWNFEKLTRTLLLPNTYARLLLIFVINIEQAFLHLKYYKDKIRGVSRTLSNFYDARFCKNGYQLKHFIYFYKKRLLLVIDRISNPSLAITSTLCKYSAGPYRHESLTVTWGERLKYSFFLNCRMGHLDILGQLPSEAFNNHKRVT